MAKKQVCRCVQKNSITLKTIALSDRMQVVSLVLVRLSFVGLAIAGEDAVFAVV